MIQQSLDYVSCIMWGPRFMSFLFHWSRGKTLKRFRFAFWILIIATVTVTFVTWVTVSKEKKILRSFRENGFLSNTFKFLKERLVYHDVKAGSDRIPRILHQIWNDEIIPTEFVENVKGLVKHNNSPSWQYYFWSQETAKNLIRDKFPEFIETFEKYPKEGTYRPDAIRYVVLHEYGGVYLDLDTVSVKPLEPFLDEHSCALVNEPEEHFAIAYQMPSLLANNALFCRPHHPFYKHVIDSLPSLLAKGCLRSKNIHDCTGPHAFNRLYNAYPNKSLDDLDIVPIDLFNDIYDIKGQSRTVHRICNNRTLQKPVFQKKACDTWKSRGFDARNISTRAFTYHTWYHVHRKRNVSFKPQNNISLIVPNVKRYAGPSTL